MNEVYSIKSRLNSDLATDDFQQGLALTPGNAEIKKALDNIDPKSGSLGSALKKAETTGTDKHRFHSSKDDFARTTKNRVTQKR